MTAAWCCLRVQAAMALVPAGLRASKQVVTGHGKAFAEFHILIH